MNNIIYCIFTKEDTEQVIEITNFVETKIFTQKYLVLRVSDGRPPTMSNWESYNDGRDTHMFLIFVSSSMLKNSVLQNEFKENYLVFGKKSYLVLLENCELPEDYIKRYKVLKFFDFFREAPLLSLRKFTDDLNSLLFPLLECKTCKNNYPARSFNCACPNCGRHDKLNSGKQTHKLVICNKCKNLYTTDFANCPGTLQFGHCGEPTYENCREFVNPEDRLNCSACNTLYSSSKAFCPDCFHLNITLQNESSRGFVTCKNKDCGYQYTSKDSDCPSCGTMTFLNDSKHYAKPSDLLKEKMFYDYYQNHSSLRNLMISRTETFFNGIVSNVEELISTIKHYVEISDSGSHYEYNLPNSYKWIYNVSLDTALEFLKGNSTGSTNITIERSPCQFKIPSLSDPMLDTSQTPPALGKTKILTIFCSSDDWDQGSLIIREHNKMWHSLDHFDSYNCETFKIPDRATYKQLGIAACKEALWKVKKNHNSSKKFVRNELRENYNKRIVGLISRNLGTSGLSTDIEKYIKKLDSEAMIDNISKSKKVLSEQKKRFSTKLALAAQKTEETRSIAVALRKIIKKTELCPYCNNELKQAHLDHIHPVIKGGLSIEANLIYVCSSCNISKKDKTLREFIKINRLDRDRIENTLENLLKSF